MKTMRADGTRPGIALAGRRRATLLAVLGLFLGLFWIVAGCGDAVKESTTNTGSSTITVGGTSVTGEFVKLDISANRTKIAKGDQVLITVVASCAKVSISCPITSGGTPLFSAHPTSDNDTSTSDLTLSINYGVTSAGTISKSSDSFKLSGGTAATITSGVVTTPAKLGQTASSISFSNTLTGASDGAAIVSAQVLNTTASIIIDVANNASVIFK